MIKFSERFWYLRDLLEDARYFLNEHPVMGIATMLIAVMLVLWIVRPDGWEKGFGGRGAQVECKCSCACCQK
jgi:hypothetical protein